METEGLKGILSAETFKEPSQREDSKKQVKKLFEERYISGKNKWFFERLRVCVNKYIISKAPTNNAACSTDYFFRIYVCVCATVRMMCML